MSLNDLTEVIFDIPLRTEHIIKLHFKGKSFFISTLSTGSIALNKFEFQKYQVVLYTRLKTLVFFARSVVDNFAQS